MIIERHTHVYPPEEAAASPLWGGRCPMAVENVLAAHHKAGLAVNVVSNAAHYLRGKDAKDELENFPRAKIVGSHGGGGICQVIGRLDYAYELQDEAFFLGSYAIGSEKAA